jgi:hypothetical protein
MNIYKLVAYTLATTSVLQNNPAASQAILFDNDNLRLGSDEFRNDKARCASSA